MGSNALALTVVIDLGSIEKEEEGKVKTFWEAMMAAHVTQMTRRLKMANPIVISNGKA